MGASTKLKENKSENPVKTKKPKRKQKDETEDLPSDSKKSKFNISLKVQEASEPLADLPALNSGKGPKIIIAKDKKKEKSEGEAGTGKRRRRLNKRSKKRLAEGLPLEDIQHESKGQSKAIQYLKAWASDRDNWKFEKCRQIWLLHNAYEKTKVSDEDFPTLLDYVQSIKGGMRQMALDIANKKLKSSEDLDKDDENSTSQNTAELEEVKIRAEKLVAVLNTE